MSKQESDSVFDETIRESLSALLDGEATELETRRILANSESNLEIRSTWSRYHVASRAMRGESTGVTTLDLSSSIAAAIADEPVYSDVASGAANDKQHFYGGAIASHIGKLAIAASVAVVAVFAANQIMVQTVTPDSSVEVARVANVPSAQEDLSSASNLPMGYGTPGLSVRNVSTDGGQLEQRRYNNAPFEFVPRADAQATNPAVEEFLRQLMAEHANVGSEAQGTMPFERVPRIVIENE